MQTEPSGVLIIDKPKGMTSHDVVWRIRRLYGTKSVGHTGTLDPDATGVLVVLVGRAVKASEYLTANDKHYSCTLTLGLKTDTEDIGGNVLQRSDALPKPDEVIATAQSFIGPSKQVPPMYSALKVGGKKLCDLARRGIEIEREARDIEVYSLEIAPCCASEPCRDYKLSLSVSKGTYIRSLCRDIGDKLGCGGVMSALRREKSGLFSLEGALTLQQLENMDEKGRIAALIPTEKLFFDLSDVFAGGRALELLKNGGAVDQRKLGVTLKEGSFVRVYDEQGFLALGEAVADEYLGRTIPSLKIKKLFRL